MSFVPTLYAESISYCPECCSETHGTLWCRCCGRPRVWCKPCPCLGLCEHVAPRGVALGRAWQVRPVPAAPREA